MIETQTPKSKRPASVHKAVVPRLFFLDASGGRILSVNPDGSDKRVIVTSAGPIPDGIVVDAEAGHVYWTNMGNPIKNDGSIERAGMRVMRSNVDGLKIDTLVDSSGGDPRPGPDQTKWCVGITVDPEGGKI